MTGVKIAIGGRVGNGDEEMKKRVAQNLLVSRRIW